MKSVGLYIFNLCFYFENVINLPDFSLFSINNIFLRNESESKPWRCTDDAGTSRGLTGGGERRVTEGDLVVCARGKP